MSALGEGSLFVERGGKPVRLAARLQSKVRREFQALLHWLRQMASP
jgi:hypothetical protein